MQIKGIDQKDNEIINLLTRNARLSYSEIGEEIGLSRTAVKNRIVSLEERGIICGYRAIINPQESAETMTFIINIETRPEHFEDVRQALAAAPETVILVQTTGNCHLVAFCIAPDVETMRTFVNFIYKTVPGIHSISANSIIDIVKGNIISE